MCKRVLMEKKNLVLTCDVCVCHGKKFFCINHKTAICFEASALGSIRVNLNAHKAIRQQLASIWVVLFMLRGMDGGNTPTTPHAAAHLANVAAHLTGGTSRGLAGGGRSCSGWRC